MLAPGLAQGQSRLREMGTAYLAAQLFGAVLLTHLLKMGVDRMRPHASPDAATGVLHGLHASFPSSHTVDVAIGALFRADAGSGTPVTAARGRCRPIDGAGAPRARPALCLGCSGRAGSGGGDGYRGCAGLPSAPFAAARAVSAHRIRPGIDSGAGRALQPSSVSPNTLATRLRRYRYSPSATDARKSTMARPIFSTGSRCVPLPTRANTRVWGR